MPENKMEITSPQDIVKSFDGQVQYQRGVMQIAKAKGDEPIEPRWLRNVSFSSETPYERWFGLEELGHKPKEIRKDRLKGGLSVFFNHVWGVVHGKLHNWKIVDGKLRGDVYFSSKEESLKVKQDIDDGIITDVSIGYFVHEMKLISEKDEVKTYRVIDWEPYEVSFVTVAADITVGVGSGRSINKEVQNEMEVKKMPDTVKDVKATPQIDINAERETARQAVLQEERTRVRDITKMGAVHHLVALAKKMIDGGFSIAEARTSVLEALEERGELEKTTPLTAETKTMDEKDAPRYSLLRAIDLSAKGLQVDGLEGEASKELTRKLGKAPQGFYFAPEGERQHISMTVRQFNDMKRSLNANVGAQGGFMVGTNLLAGSFIDLERNRMLLNTLGMQTLAGLIGNVAIPGQNGAATGYWVSPGSDIDSDSQASIIQKAGTPHQYMVQTVLDRSFIQQATPDGETFARMDMAIVSALGQDLAGINGSGIGAEPEGINNTSGVGDVTANAVPGWNDYVDLETDVAVANADVNGMAYLTTPEIRGLGKQTLKASGVAGYIITGGQSPGVSECNGYPLYVTNQVPKTLGGASDEHLIIFGDFTQLVRLMWGGRDVIVNPYSLDSSGKTRITMIQNIDFLVRNPAGFSLCKDARLS